MRGVWPCAGPSRSSFAAARTLRLATVVAILAPALVAGCGATRTVAELRPVVARQAAAAVTPAVVAGAETGVRRQVAADHATLPGAMPTPRGAAESLKSSAYECTAIGRVQGSWVPFRCNSALTMGAIAGVSATSTCSVSTGHCRSWHVVFIFSELSAPSVFTLSPSR
jgi:hypothetical protein